MKPTRVTKHLLSLLTALLLTPLAALHAAEKNTPPACPEIFLADFEHGYDDWAVKGEAFNCEEGMWHYVLVDEVVASDSPGKEARVFQPRSQCVPVDKQLDLPGMRSLVVPVNNLAPMVQCMVEVDGQPMQDIAVHLAIDAPVDFWASYPLGDWTGRRLRLRSIEEREVGRLHRAADGSVYFENWKELSAEALARVSPAAVMNIPVEVTLRNSPTGPRLYLNLVKEIETLVSHRHDFKDVPLSDLAAKLAGIKPGLFDIEFE